MSQDSWSNRTIGFSLQTIGYARLSVLCSFQVFLTALMVTWGWEIQQLGYVSVPLGRMGRGHSRLHPIFPKWAFWLGEARSYLQSSYELIPLGVAGEYSLPVLILLWSQSAFPDCISTWAFWGLHHFHMIWPAPLARGDQETFSPMCRAVTQFLVRVWANKPPRSTKLFLWGFWSGRSIPQPTEFPDQNVPASWFCRWAKPLVEISTWALQVLPQSAEIHLLVVESPYHLLHHSQIPSGWVSLILLQSP